MFKLFISTLVVFLCSLSVKCFIFDHPDGVVDHGPRGGDTVPALAEPPLKIASFNIQIFGVSKFGRADVVDILLKILSRYDIVQVLEIRDSTNTVFEKLRVALNNFVSNGKGEEVYAKVVSDRLGRSNSKEQYGFLYRSSKVTVTDTYQYQDRNDYFEREPFSVKFNSKSTTIEDFVMMANHIQPSGAVEELDNLTRVYETVKRHWGIEDILISGDFNADCSYLTLGKWKNISLRNDDRFEWLMPDDTDTTVATSPCNYDRFVVAGTRLLDAVVPSSVGVYRFDDVMGLTKQQGLRVSDHYPIEMQLKGKPHVAIQQSIQTSISFTVKDTTAAKNVNSIRAIYRTPSCAGTRFAVKLQKEDTHMDFVQAKYSTEDPTQIVPTLASFSSSCPGTLSANLLTMTGGYLQSHFLTITKPVVYGLMYSIKKNTFDVTVICSLKVPYVCEVTVSKNIS